MKLSIKEIVLVALFTSLIAVGAFIKIPVSIVPITMQTLFVLSAALILPKNLAVLSTLLYLFIGLMGVPVFANGGGPMYVLQPSFGYLIGFVICAFVVSKYKDRASNQLLLCFAGMLIIYLVGMVYFFLLKYFVYGILTSWGFIFYYLFLVYLPGDILSCILAVFISKRLSKVAAK